MLSPFELLFIYKSIHFVKKIYTVYIKYGYTNIFGQCHLSLALVGLPVAEQHVNHYVDRIL